MPYDWVEPAEFMHHRDVIIYHVYKDDCFQSGPRSYWFAVDERGGDNDGHGDHGVFNVQELDAWPQSGREVEECIRIAIDNGELYAVVGDEYWPEGVNEFGHKSP